MKTDFKFSNLLGTVYCKGNLCFTPDGTCLVSPVGNRVTIFDLISNKSHTLSFSHRSNIHRLALDPKGTLLLSVDGEGQAILTNLQRRVALYHISFKGQVTALSFSPSGRYFAVGIGRFVQVWNTPSTPESGSGDGLLFAPFVKHRVYTGHHDTVRRVEWSSDSRFFLTSAKDSTARIWSVDPEDSFVPTVLTGHRETVLAAWFSPNQESIYTVSQDGALFRWLYLSRHLTDGDQEISEDADSSMQWRIADRHYFMQSNAKTTCVAYHASSKLLVAGFSSGLFALYELPDLNMIHSLSISQNSIDTVNFNLSGEWLAFGISRLGQLLVWEWQSESYILKQQGHFDSLNAVTYSPDARRVVSCADDGKIKLWDTQSGFCIATFTEHSSAVTACEFAKRGNVLFTASLDGSIRAWDLVRYRNFRTFTAPTRLSFSSLAVDPSGEVVCAGSLDSTDIHIWSVQTGQFLDQLAGHEGPVATLAFAPSGTSLISGSWDNTVRIWNIFGRSQSSEPLQLQANVLALALRPDSKQVAVSTLDGQLSFWSLLDAVQEVNADGRRDISGGRRLTDRFRAANYAGAQAFRCLVYSADSTCIIAGGDSKYVCLYSVHTGSLVQKFTVSINLSIEGTQEFLNSRNLTEAGPLALLDDNGAASDLEDRIDNTLPGARRGDLSKRHFRPEIRVTALSFSPTGNAFCVSSTEGLSIYSLDHTPHFDPIDMDIEVTPSNLRNAIRDSDYLSALIMAFRLNEKYLIKLAYEAVPIDSLSIIVKSLPTTYIGPLLRFVAQATDENPHLEFNCRWLEAILSAHGSFLKDHASLLPAELRMVQKATTSMQTDLAKLTDYNAYAIDYLLLQSSMA